MSPNVNAALWQRFERAVIAVVIFVSLFVRQSWSQLLWVAQNSGFGPGSPWYDVRFAAVNDKACWGIHFRSSNRFTRTTDGGEH